MAGGEHVLEVELDSRLAKCLQAIKKAKGLTDEEVLKLLVEEYFEKKIKGCGKR